MALSSSAFLCIINIMIGKSTGVGDLTQAQWSMASGKYFVESDTGVYDWMCCFCVGDTYRVAAVMAHSS